VPGIIWTIGLFSLGLNNIMISLSLRFSCLLHVFVLVWFGGSVSSSAQVARLTPPRLIASYTLDGTAVDATGNSAPMNLSNTSFSDNTLFLNGHYGPPEGFGASARITGLSYNSFTVSLDFKSLDFSCFEGRDECHDTIIVGGEAYRWFGLRNKAGKLEVTLNNQSFTATIPNANVMTGAWQRVICSVSVATKKVIAVLDNSDVASVDLPSDFRFEIVGTPSESSDNIFTFDNYGSPSAFTGYIDNLKVWDRALSEAELSDVAGPPDLNIERSVTLSWASISPGWLLQVSTNINGPYENYTGTIFFEANQSKAAVPIGASPKFFQLVKP
jgi:hypothetical protein